MKKIIFISKYALAPDSGQHSRLFDIANIFSRKKYNVEIISSISCCYNYDLNNYKKSILFYWRQYDRVKHILIKGPKISQGFSLIRIFSWIIFELYLFAILLFRKFDYLYISSLPLFTVINGYIFKCIKKSPFILEIRDIWPESLIQIGNYSKKNLFIKFLYFIEKIGYKNAIHIVSPLENFNKYLDKKKINYSFFYVPMDIPKIDVKLSGIINKNRTFNICYAGSFGYANGIGEFLRIISSIDVPDHVKFTFIGRGQDYNKLKQKYQSEKIIFKPFLPLVKLIDHISNYDMGLHIIPEREIYNYGISPNKWGTYFLSGLCVLTISELNQTFLTKNKIGYNVKFNKNSISKFLKENCNISNKTEHKKKSLRAYEIAKKDLNLTNNLTNLINNL